MRILLAVIGVLAVLVGFLGILIARNGINEIAGVVGVMGGFVLIGMVMLAGTIDKACSRLISAMGLREP